MKFTYRFPAVRGIQAQTEYYIAMIPLKFLTKLFPSDDDIVLPQYRAQRKINDARIPEIKKYILENRNTYVFSALSASIDGFFKFEESSDPNIGILEVDMDATFLINDGQHRKAAIESAMVMDESLAEETISIVFFKDNGLARSQQMFTDLNKHAVKTSNSLATLYDYRDEIAVATRNVIDAVPFFKLFTDKERDNLGKNSCNLFTLNTIYKANKKILHGETCKEKDEEFLKKYWFFVSKNISEWQDIMNKSLTKRDIRENYIITLNVTLAALGRLGRFFYDHSEIDMEKELSKLQNINWLRSNEDWMGRTIRDNGKINNSEEASTLTCSKIKQIIGIELNKEETQKENQLRGKK